MKKISIIVVISAISIYLVFIYIYYNPGRHGKSINVLIKQLCDRSIEEWKRSEAAEIIGEIGPRAKKSVPHLIRIIKAEDEDDDIRSASMYALCDVLKDSSVPILIEMVNNKNDNIKEDALRNLSQFCRPKKLCDLVKLLHTNNCEAKIIAVTEMARIGKPAINELFSVENVNNDCELDLYIAKALGKYGDKSALPILEIIVNNEKNNVKEEAENAIKMIEDRNKINNERN